MNPAVIPVVYRPGGSAMSHKLRATLSGWDNIFWDLKDWYREDLTVAAAKDAAAGRSSWMSKGCEAPRAV